VQADDRVQDGREVPARPFVDSLRVQQRFWLLVATTGAAAGAGAALLVEILAFVQALAWPHASGDVLEGARSAGVLRTLLVTGLAGALVAAVSLSTGGPVGGHGTAGILEAIWLKAGRFPLGRALLRGLLTIVVVGLGAPLGREGAVMSAGAGAGSALASVAALPDPKRRVLVACGAAAGIAAAYDVPIGGALFGLEVLLGSFALELLGPIVVASVTATAVSRILLATHPAYAIPEYHLGRPAGILGFLAVAPLLGLASALLVLAVEKSAVWSARAEGRRWAPLLPLGAMLATGALALRFPEILGNGYETVDGALRGRIALPLLLALPLLKLVAMAATSGAGVPGGMFTPSLFFGALLGGAFGELVHAAIPGSAPPGAYALVGMASVLAGTTHATVSSVVIIFEMTRDWGVVLPLLLACAVAAQTSRLVTAESLYTAVLRRRNVAMPERPRPDWLRQIPVSSLLSREFVAVAPSLPFEEVLVKLLGVPPGHDLYVTAADGRLLGVVVLDQLKGNLPDQANLRIAVAADLMDSGMQPLAEGTTLAAAAQRFASVELDRLPFVDASGRLVGTVSKSELIKLGRF